MTMKHTPFVKMPLTVLFDARLKPIDVKVYGVLRSHYNEKSGNEVFPSYEALHKETNRSVDSIMRAVKNLVLCGHVQYDKGHSGRSNRYYFPDTIIRNFAGNVPASVQVPTSNNVKNISAGVRPQVESGNKNNKSDKLAQLFHGNDRAIVMNTDGLIHILIHTGQWVPYGGGADDLFVFGGLCGTDARRAAIKQFINSQYAKK